MARTVEQIEKTITERLSASFNLSTSAVAEWRLWVHCVAYAIHLFEVILDMFRKEIQEAADKLVVGTLTWYNNKCYEFQDGYQLEFNNSTGLLEYPVSDEQARIIKIAAVNAENGGLYFRVATTNSTGEVIPITDVQMINFKNYIDAIKFAGTRSTVISTTGDQIHYIIRVFYDPATPVAMVNEDVLESLTEFKTSQRFGGVIYRHRLLEAVTTVSGVVTAEIILLERKAMDSPVFVPVGAYSYLHAGYFNYTDDSELELVSINDGLEP